MNTPQLGAATRRRLAYVGWAVLVCLVLFWRLGEPTFWDPDEAHYAQTSRELIASGDWMAPTYNGQPFFDKPVFFHQLQALTMLAVGPNELGARLISALAGLALIAVTWWLGTALCSAEIGLTAAVLLTTCPAIFALARYAILDMVFTAFLFGGAALVTVAALRNRPRLQFGGYVLIALAVTTKGPVGLALCGLAFLLAIAVSADARRQLLSLHWIAGLAIAVAISAPWFAYMLLRFNQAFVTGYLLNENLLLFAKPLYANQPGWTFYLRVVALGLLPWTPVLVGRLFDTATAAIGRREPLDGTEAVLWSWVAAVILFFSASRFKLDHYVFPIAPALYLLCARALADARAGTDARHAGARIGFLWVGPILIAAGGVSAWLLVEPMELPAGAVALPVALCIAGALLTGHSSARIARAPWVAAAAFGVLYAVSIAWIMPAIERQKVVDNVARWIASQGEPARVCSYQLNRWNNSFRFYAQRHVTMIDSLDEFRRFMADDGDFHCAMPESAYLELVGHGIDLPITYEMRGLWATSGEALWRRANVPTRFLVVSQTTPEP